MKIRRFIPKQKLQAIARRLPQRAAMEDFEEPTMSFVKALVVVVMLHLVAVGGIFAFESVKKAHKIALPDSMPRSAQESAAPVENKNDAGGLKNAGATVDGRESKLPARVATKSVSETAKPVETARKKGVEEPATRAGTKSPGKETSASAKDSGEVYTVLKGDNPVAIARKFHVNYDELLKINKIEDPKKLQIGQKLRIPAKNKNQ